MFECSKSLISHIFVSKPFKNFEINILVKNVSDLKVVSLLPVDPPVFPVILLEIKLEYKNVSHSNWFKVA